MVSIGLLSFEYRDSERYYVGASARSGLSMSRRHVLRALSFGWAVLLSTSCLAATLEPTQGSLSINRGKGFRPVSHRIVAHAGDAVMVGPGGSARLVYADGCKVDVVPGTVLTVTQLSPCASGSMAAQDDRRYYLTPDGWVTVGLVAGVFAGVGYLAFSP